MFFLKTLRERAVDNYGRQKRVRGSLRAGAYLLIPLLACGAFSVRNAKAEYTNTTLQFGKQMLELSRMSNQEITTITYNGQQMYLGSSTSDEPPKAVLARYEDYCKKNPGQPTAGWDEYEKRAGKVDEGATDKAGLVMTTEKAEEGGMVACFVKGDRMKATVEEALQAFFTTGDLGALGEMRYAYAVRGESGRTLLLTAWTDSKFNLFETAGDGKTDVKGEDFREVPRVPNSVRMLSARAEGTPYGVNMYKTSDSPAQVLAFYDLRLRGQGWTAYDPQLKDIQGRGYLKDGVVLSMATSEEETGNYVTLGLAGVNGDDRKVIGRHP